MTTNMGSSGETPGAGRILRVVEEGKNFGTIGRDVGAAEGTTLFSTRQAMVDGRVVVERITSLPDDQIEVIERIEVPALPPDRVVYAHAKRAVDVVGSATLIILTSPAMALLWIAVRLDSRGPAIFRQERVGRDGRIFRFYKFRTMYVDARERYPDLYAYDYSPEDVETMFFKLPHDPRLTRLGKRLRRTSLDELPNLFCVLLGRMTLVGPRPEIPEMVPYYSDDQLTKFSVKPGLTGLAQVSGRNILRFQETIAADLAYVETRGFLRDLWILLRTFKAVVLMMGAH